jgi:integrase
VQELILELAPKSVRNVVGLVSAALTVAVIDEKIDRNPLSKIKLKAMLPKRRKKEEEKIDPFNQLKIQAILAACPTPEDKSIWQFAFFGWPATW